MKSANYAPVYAAAMYPDLADITRKHGYALAAHGSLARDLDLVCIPWTVDAADPQVVVDAIMDKFAVRQLKEDRWSFKEHGRRVTTLTVGFGECFIDLSFMPRLYD